eukprot:5965843-Pleurochrysis_carterae.AAC.2
MVASATQCEKYSPRITRLKVGASRALSSSATRMTAAQPLPALQGLFRLELFPVHEQIFAMTARIEAAGSYWRRRRKL